MPKDVDPKNQPDASEVSQGEKPEVNEEQYAFLRETIKKDHGSRVRFRKQCFRMILFGLLFGVFACFSFFALKPWVEKMFGPETGRLVILAPEDESDTPDGELISNEEEGLIEDPLTDIPTSTEGSDNPDFNDALSVELTAESYREIMNAMHEIALVANKSIVYIEGVDSEAEWYGEEMARTTRITGLIIAETDSDLLILSNNQKADFPDFAIILADDTHVQGHLQLQDHTRGIAVYSISKDQIDSGSLLAIEIATLANSNLTRQGDIVIALGNILGHGDGLAYGILGSNQAHTSQVDTQYRLLGTDITISPQGSGFLFNAQGAVTGMIMPGPWQNEISGTANALAISDIKLPIDMLVNGEPLPFLGITGILVTEEISQLQGIPTGIYVSQVEIDSPAMRAGIQNGDVIISINDNITETMPAFTRAILGSRIGESSNIVAARRGTHGYVEMEFAITLTSRP